MKEYKVYFTDYPDQAMKCRAENKTEARKIGNQYIRAWRLSASIDRIEEVK